MQNKIQELEEEINKSNKVLKETSIEKQKLREDLDSSLKALMASREEVCAFF
jgi:septal ring factor EnvC (AmiA/AmiB activator)